LPIIETHNLTKKYKDLIAVNGINLKIEDGEIFGLLGPNGAGKSTVLLMLATLRKPTHGMATVNGFDVLKDPDKVRKSIGIVFQDPSSDDTLTGYENLKLHGLLYGMPAELREKRIREVLELLDLYDRRNERVKNYSGGMRRRLELARGLMHHPKVLFLDEPTLGLDPQAREHIWKYIEKLASEEKMTVIITTHYMDEADRLCDRIAIIDLGKIVALDTPDNLKRVVGGDVIELKCKGCDSRKLKELPYVKKVEAKDGSLLLTVVDASKHLNDILKVAGEVESVQVHRPTLEDVFIHYTGKEIRDNTPEGGWAQRVMNVRSNK